MSAGNFTPTQRDSLKQAIRTAEEVSGLQFSLYVGDSGGEPRAYAYELLDSMADTEDSVLVLCDPEKRALEIVTGRRARRSLHDDECRLAAMSMQSSFAAGDLVGGLRAGIQQLGGAARAPRVLHVTEQN